jgi:hypothetical protein
LSVEGAFALFPDAATLRGGGAPRWAFDPPEATREIAATFGEVRGVVGGARQAWFHNGLDVPGNVGETTRFVRSERMLLPLSVEDFNTGRERIRLPLFGYIHVRIGRTHDDFPVINDDRFILVRDEGGGRTREVRIRRGTRFNAGEPVGTLNGQAHVHLIAGAAGAEVNALAALELPGASDSIKPTIVRSAVRFERANGEAFATINDSKSNGGKPILIDEDARIVVRAYDQMDGNLERRRLGVYALGFQILRDDGTPTKALRNRKSTSSFCVCRNLQMLPPSTPRRARRVTRTRDLRLHRDQPRARPRGNPRLMASEPSCRRRLYRARCSERFLRQRRDRGFPCARRTAW